MISDRRVASMPGWAPMVTSAAYWTAVRSPPHSSAKYAEEAWCTRRMRWPGSRANDSRTFRRLAAVVIAVDSIEIVRILSNAFRRSHVHPARGHAGASRLLRAHWPSASGAALDVARQAGHARAGQRLPAGGVVVRRHPRRDDRGRRPDYRQRGRTPRAHPRESRPAWPVEDHDRPLCRRATRAAGRGRTGPPARAERLALRARGGRRAYGRQRRADVDALRRFHHHAADGVARPRQRDGSTDVLARRA